VACYSAGVPPSIAAVLAPRRIVVCAGSGGVGKTTTAATLALRAAAAGKKTLVVTIDPAKRLATALGLAELDHTERKVADEQLALAGPVAAGGALYAMMLDQKRSFDELVERYAKDAAGRERILRSRIYQQMSTSLAGAQEYAAMGKLYQLAGESDYECIVIDTPPTAHALDFLDAPEKLAGLVDSPALEWFIKPLQESGRFSFKLLSRGGAFVLKRIAKFVGSGFLEDMAHFFVDFNDVMGGFRERAREVSDLLRSNQVGFVVVTAPEPEPVDEALLFANRLLESRMPLAGFVVNRVQTDPGVIYQPGTIEALFEARPVLQAVPPAERAEAAAAFVQAGLDAQRTAAAHRAEVERLKSVMGAEHALALIPNMERDVHDIDALGELARHLG
jgi:anion-transporting  ArsA/GET3 family ATPase